MTLIFAFICTFVLGSSVGFLVGKQVGVLEEKDRLRTRLYIQGLIKRDVQ